MSEKTLTHDQARKFYDRFGSRLDGHAFYEDIGIRELIHHADFESATSVLEIGCGTGRIAHRLFSDHLPEDARYLGLDVSEEMVRLTRERLAPFSDRIEVRQTEGEMAVDRPDASFDRVLSTYVLDLLSDSDIARFFAESRRLLNPEGRVCVVSLTEGDTIPSRLIVWLWRTLHGLNPKWVGGCRPVRLIEHLDEENWELLHHSVARAWGLREEVLVARPV